MEKITSVIKRLKENSHAYPNLSSLKFKQSGIFGWNNTANTVYYNPKMDNAADYLLHEYAHAVLGHDKYSTDIQLLEIERDTWELAIKLGVDVDLTIDPKVIESSLDTYRDWLHARSLCPNCEATGLQQSNNQYKCIACGHQWKVNEARSCALRRYDITKTPTL